MIAVDTSALMAVLLAEPEASDCIACLKSEPSLLISAATTAEALIVAERRGLGEEMSLLLEKFGFQVVPVTSTSAHRVATAYRHWGKGVHPAGLNFGDCFAYEVARSHGCSLLFVGKDFSQTDVRSALSNSRP